MKRNIKDLKPNEAIEIKSEKDLKHINKLTLNLKPLNIEAPCFYTINGFYVENLEYPVIYPASDFIKKPNKLKKRVKELEDMVTNLDGKVKQLENLWAKDAYKMINVEYNETVKEPQIDWSKPLQILEMKSKKLIVLSTGIHIDNTFEGICIKAGESNNSGGSHSEYWDKKYFTLHKGQITLSNQ